MSCAPHGQADVEEPPLLFDVRSLTFALVGQQPFLAADDEHHRKLQPLRRVQAHQRHTVGAGS